MVVLRAYYSCSGIIPGGLRATGGAKNQTYFGCLGGKLLAAVLSLHSRVNLQAFTPPHFYDIHSVN